MSHWVLDFVTHVPDMPLWPWSSQVVGLGLGNSVPGTAIVEALMFAAGVWVYSSSTTGRDRIGRVAWWGFVLFMIVAYVMNLRGVPPPTVTAMAWAAGVAGVVTILWAWWADRHRAATGGG